MAEYISREAVLNHLDECRKNPLFDPEMARMCVAISMFIEDMQAADVQPVKHGRWLVKFEGEIYEFSECSECGNTESCETPYCAQCGARMDGDAE